MIYKIQTYFKHITKFTVLFTFSLSTDTHNSTTILWWSIHILMLKEFLVLKYLRSH